MVDRVVPLLVLARSWHFKVSIPAPTLTYGFDCRSTGKMWLMQKTEEMGKSQGKVAQQVRGKEMELSRAGLVPLRDDRLCNNYIFNILEKQEVTEKELYDFIHLLENLEKNASLGNTMCKYLNALQNKLKVTYQVFWALYCFFTNSFSSFD